jgi:hypothetical protein
MAWPQKLQPRVLPVDADAKLESQAFPISMLQQRVKLRCGLDSYFQVHDSRIHTIREHKFAVRALDDANFVKDAGIERRNDADHFVEGRISVIPRVPFAEPLFQGFDSGNTTEPPGRTVLLAMACMSTTN